MQYGEGQQRMRCKNMKRSHRCLEAENEVQKHEEKPQVLGDK